MPKDAANPWRFRGAVPLREPTSLGSEPAPGQPGRSFDLPSPAIAASGEDSSTALRAFLPGRRRSPDATWHVLHTLSRQEKLLAATLRGFEIACFLPLRPHVRRRGGAKIVSQLPLFPGYLFLWGTLDDAYLADRTRRVANVVRVPDPAHLEWELRNIDLALRAQVPVDPYESLRTGLRARVLSGPCAGVEGLIASRDRADRLVLHVVMLGTAVCLDVDPALVELVDEPLLAR